MAIFEAWQGSLSGDLSVEEYEAVYALDGAIKLDVPVEALGASALGATSDSAGDISLEDSITAGMHVHGSWNRLSPADAGRTPSVYELHRRAGHEQTSFDGFDSSALDASFDYTNPSQG